jgi:membrane associated rhomboid family serine protease
VLPLRDDNPTRRFPVVTVLLIVINIGVYFGLQPQQGEQAQVRVGEIRVQVPADLAFNLENAAVPCEVVQGRPLSVVEIEDTFGDGDTEACADSGPRSRGPSLFPDKSVLLAVLASMFLHGGLLHLGGNMLFLWIFGNNIEDHLGPLRFIVFYVGAGVVATIAHIAVQPDSTVPVVGASGAIAGVMGAYLVWFPNAPILTLFIFFIILFRQISAKWLLGFWLVSQFFVNPNSGVAWVAHVGGFVFGALLGLVVRASRGAQRAALKPVYRDPARDPWR